MMTVEEATEKARYIAKSIGIEEKYWLSFTYAVETIANALLEASRNGKGE